VLWRVTVDSHSADGARHINQMDVVYLGARDVLVKIRVASCGCHGLVDAGDLLPGETTALQATALYLARG
jgi:hypothetical protein